MWKPILLWGSKGLMFVEAPGLYSARSWLSVNTSALSSGSRELQGEREPNPATRRLGSPLRAELCHILLHSPMVVPEAVALASLCLRQWPLGKSSPTPKESQSPLGKPWESPGSCHEAKTWHSKRNWKDRNWTSQWAAGHVLFPFPLFGVWPHWE